MKKSLLIAVLLVLATAIPVNAQDLPPVGVDDLRGRWDVAWSFDHDLELQLQGLTWLIQDIQPHPEQENVFLANGCMRTQESGKLAPLALVATYQPDSHAYTLLLYSTVIPAEWEPFVTQFDGEALIFGSGVRYDAAGGTFISDPGPGTWTARHHDRRRPSCEGMEDSDLLFNGDVYAHMDTAPSTPRYRTLFEAFTMIVSSGMLVETPTGEIIHVPSYNDIYTPNVDFINLFRYAISIEGQPPIAGETYTFTLLDILGNPIPGATAVDLWTGCQQIAPVDIQMSLIYEDHIDMSWTPAPDAPGWDPDGNPQVGFYQIGIFPRFESATSYGSNGIASSSHVIPWAPFAPGSPVTPDGSDMGVSLSELDDGSYEVSLTGFAAAPPGFGGNGHECGVYDSSQFWQLEKQGSLITLVPYGTIRGFVTDALGDPIPDAYVLACEYFGGYCMDTLSTLDGSYTLTHLLAGDYRVQAHSAGYALEFYLEQADWNLATPVPVSGGATTQGIDFTLDLEVP